MRNVGGRNIAQPDPLNPKLFGKSRALIHETMGDFDIEEGRAWFLSDGGHFENTGAYALLAERAKVVVVVDAGADPDYQFDDLENLVRKARIDLRCDITFLKPIPANSPNLVVPIQPALHDYGSLNDLVSNQSHACLALARIDYLDDGTVGHLILVKPNLCGGLPVDLFNFKAEQPAFPQQSTADQFFDEAQWESYFQLGTALGGKLSAQNVSAVLANSGVWFVEDDGSPVHKHQPTGSQTADAADTSTDAPTTRLPARIAVNAVGATLGLGAISAVAVGAWQGIDAVRSMVSRQGDSERAAQKELADLWGKVPPAGAPQREVAIGALAGALARASENLCSDAQQGWFNRSDLAVQILGQTRAACGELKGSAPPACTYLLSLTSSNAIATHATCLASGVTEPERRLENEGCSDYWGYDYSLRALRGCGHPALAIVKSAQQRVLAENGGFVLTEPVFSSSPRFDIWHPYTSLVRTHAPLGDCFGQVIRPMVYGTSRREDIKALALRWSAMGAYVMGAVDVTAKASFEGRPQPNLVRTSTVQYVEGSALKCASAVVKSYPSAHFAKSAETAERLARGTIIVWLTADTSREAVEQLRAAAAVSASAPSNPGLLPLPSTAPAASSSPPLTPTTTAPPSPPASAGASNGSTWHQGSLQECIERAICATVTATPRNRRPVSTKAGPRTKSPPGSAAQSPPACSSGEVMACTPKATSGVLNR